MQIDSQPLPPISPDQFAQWLSNPVTEHLFKDLEAAFLDSALDPLPFDSIDKIAIESIRRETVRACIDLILEWEPEGAEKDDEGDQIGNE